MPVLIRLTTRPRPGNRASAISVPSGTPTSSERPVAVAEIWSDRRVIRSTSGSPLTSSQTACRTPSKISSIA